MWSIEYIDMSAECLWIWFAKWRRSSVVIVTVRSSVVKCKRFTYLAQPRRQIPKQLQHYGLRIFMPQLCIGINFYCENLQRFLMLFLSRRYFVWLGGLVVSALGMRTRRPPFKSRVTPLFHWVATLGKLFTHIASPVSQLQETGIQKGGVFSA